MYLFIYLKDLSQVPACKSEPYQADDDKKIRGCCRGFFITYMVLCLRFWLDLSDRPEGAFQLPCQVSDRGRCSDLWVCWARSSLPEELDYCLSELQDPVVCIALSLCYAESRMAFTLSCPFSTSLRWR